MITIISGKLFIPEEERFIGFAGDNLHTKKQFWLENITDENCIYRLYLEFDDGTVNYFVLDSKVENRSTILTWNILEEHIFKSGIVKAQIKSISENGETYHTTRGYFYVLPSAEFSGEFKDNENAEFLRYEKELNDIYKKIKNSDLDSFVTSNRSIAGLSLSSDIAETDLYEALSIYPPTLKDHAPTALEGTTGSFFIDTSNHDLYYCSGRTLSGYNWIKLTDNTATDGSVGVSIKSITQGSQSASDEGVNTLEVVLTDGSSTSFIVRNGSKGEQGPTGPQGPQGEAGTDGADGKDGYTPVKGTDYFTEADKTEIVNDITKKLNTDTVPDYWEEHLSEKISAINTLQSKGGKDCFSFIVMTDLHYPSNLGKISPLIAKRIIDECDIKYALCLGDTQTRGCHTSKEALLSENELIKDMFKPLNGHLLQTEGNHDGSYGWLDRDGDGEYSNTDTDGNIKEPAQRETYVNNLTPAELYNTIYRKSGAIGNVHFDESGTGYYVDDTSNRVRYIILNTQNNEYKLQEDGTSLYPKMWLFRFGQSQFDFVINALNNIPSETWGVVVAGHCPLWQEIGDTEVMQGVLNAYKNKTTYTGEYTGTATGGATYTNLAEPLSDNTTDTSKWVNGYRISSSGVSAQSGKTVTNKIYATTGDVIRIKGIDFVENADRGGQWLNNDNFNYAQYISSMPDTYWDYELENGDTHKFTILQGGAGVTAYIRFAFTTPENPKDIIITVNEEIKEAEHGYDYVNVDADFTSAKGSLVGYFAGHNHTDNSSTTGNVLCVTTRCDGNEENDSTLKAERVSGTTTEQSFDVFTVNKAENKIYATKIGAGDDRTISY